MCSVSKLSNEPDQELLPNIIDQRASKDPSKTIAAIPVSSHASDLTWKDVNYHEFANAVNGAAWWIHNELGTSSNFDTLAYIGPNDLRYPILVLGAVKAGFQLLLISPRNSIAGHLHLFRATNTKALLVTQPLPPPVSPIVANVTIKTLPVPDLDHLLYQQHPPFAYKASYADNWNDPLVVLHTSGTTGLPKPITWTHGFVDAFRAAVNIPTGTGEALVKQKFANARAYNALPLFHVRPFL